MRELRLIIGIRIQGPGFRVQDLEFTVYGLGLRLIIGVLPQRLPVYASRLHKSEQKRCQERQRGAKRGKERRVGGGGEGRKRIDFDCSSGSETQRISGGPTLRRANTRRDRGRGRQREGQKQRQGHSSGMDRESASNRQATLVRRSFSQASGAARAVRKRDPPAPGPF